MLHYIVLLFIGVVAALPGMPLTTSPSPGATITPMFWRGQIEAGGPEMTFNGTIQEVYAQVRKIKPDFPAGLNASRPTPLPNDEDGHEVDCWVGGSGAAETYIILEGIKHLHGINGNCGVNAGSSGYNTCSRISCSYNSAIWLCSDHGQDVQWPCWALGDIAQNDCFTCQGGSDGTQNWCQGREKWPDSAGGFHVDIGSDKC